MAKIVYFITPKTIAKLSSKALEFLPVVGPTLEFGKKAAKATEMTDPVSASSRGIGMTFNFYFGKTAAVSVECTLWLGLSVAGSLTGNPALIAASAQFGNMVIDEIID